MTFTTYVVRPGDTLWGISRRFNSSVNDLARLNGIVETDAIFAGQRLRVPTYKSPIWYVVRVGDTLFAIANKYGTTVEEIIRLNSLDDPNTIFENQIIRVR